MRRPWTADDDATLRLNYADWPTFLVAHILGRSESATFNHARLLGLSKSAKYLASPWACRLRRGDNVGAPYRYPKGYVPANKGLRRPGWAPGRMASTQFRKGQKPQTWVPVGTRVRDPEGYWKRKVRDDAPPGLSRFNWIYEHVELWEEHLGPVPPGFAVCFRNGDKADLRIDNLRLLHRSQLMRRNSIHTRYPRELVQVMQLRGAINRQINRRIRQDHAPCRTPSTTSATTSSARSLRCATRKTRCRSTAPKPSRTSRKR